MLTYIFPKFLALQTYLYQYRRQLKLLLLAIVIVLIVTVPQLVMAEDVPGGGICPGC